MILSGHADPVQSARFSPDGAWIVSGSDDRTVRVWRDLAPIEPSSPRLWQATSYCLTLSQRIDLLGVSEDVAARDHARCMRRIAQSP